MTDTLLAHFVWAVVSILGGLLPVFMFVLGGNTVVRTLARDAEKRSGLDAFFSRMWFWPLVSLAVFIGMLCVAFPLYARVFVFKATGLWSALLISFLLAAGAGLMRLSSRGWLRMAGFSLSTLVGIVCPLLVGTVFGCFFCGAPFLVEMTIDADGLFQPTGGVWLGQASGLEAFMILDNLLLGAALLYLARILSMLYLVRRGVSEEIHGRVRSLLLTEMIFFLVFFLAFVVRLCMRVGLVWSDGMFAGVFHKYLQNFVEMPAVAFFLVLGLGLLLFGIFRTIFRPDYRVGFLPAAVGTLFSFMALLLAAGLNNTPYLPSTQDWQHSLSIANSHASTGVLAISLVAGILLLLVGALCFVFRLRRSARPGEEAR